MRLNDAVSGALAATLGIAVFGYTRAFPAMTGQSVGPSLFPALIGSGLAIVGLAMVLSSRRDRATPVIAFDDWVRTRSAVVKFALVIGMLLFYVAAAEVLGFFIAGFICVAVLFFAFGVPAVRIVPLAGGVTLVIHYGFYSLLRVPLPWGLLQGIAW